MKIVGSKWAIWTNIGVVHCWFQNIAHCCAFFTQHPHNVLATYQASLITSLDRATCSLTVLPSWISSLVVKFTHSLCSATAPIVLCDGSCKAFNDQFYTPAKTLCSNADFDLFSDSTDAHQVGFLTIYNNSTTWSSVEHSKERPRRLAAWPALAPPNLLFFLPFCGCYIYKRCGFAATLAPGTGPLLTQILKLSF